MEDDRSGIVTPALFTPDLMRSPNRKEQQIRAKRMKRSDKTNHKFANFRPLARPSGSKLNGSGIEDMEFLNKSKSNSTSSSLVIRNTGSLRSGRNPATHNTTNTPRPSPTTPGFIHWNPIPGREAKNPCVKSIKKTYLTGRKELIIEFECRRATFYCRQTSSGMGRCQAIKVHHTGLNEVFTVGCKCKA